MPRKYLSALAVLVALSIILISSAVYHQRVQSKRLWASVLGENHAKMKFLQTCIAYSAAINPTDFVSNAGNGIVVEATALPGPILTNFPSITVEDLQDSWRHPFHILLSRVTSNLSGDKVTYELSVWSDGPNGLNEAGKGDDICGDKITIEAELSTK